VICFWVVLVPNNFDNRLQLRNFIMTKPAFEMLCNEMGLLVSPVIQSHPLLRQSREFFVVHRRIYLVNVFP